MLEATHLFIYVWLINRLINVWSMIMQNDGQHLCGWLYNLKRNEKKNFWKYFQNWNDLIFFIENILKFIFSLKFYLYSLYIKKEKLEKNKCIGFCFFHSFIDPFIHYMEFIELINHKCVILIQGVCVYESCMVRFHW